MHLTDPSSYKPVEPPVIQASLSLKILIGRLAQHCVLEEMHEGMEIPATVIAVKREGNIREFFLVCRDCALKLQKFFIEEYPEESKKNLPY